VPAASAVEERAEPARSPRRQQVAQREVHAGALEGEPDVVCVVSPSQRGRQRLGFADLQAEVEAADEGREDPLEGRAQLRCAGAEAELVERPRARRDREQPTLERGERHGDSLREPSTLLRGRRAPAPTTGIGAPPMPR
jgi:hypothetical protein